MANSEYRPDYGAISTFEAEVQAADDTRLAVRGGFLMVCGLAGFLGSASGIEPGLTSAMITLEGIGAVGSAVTVAIGMVEAVKRGAAASNMLGQLHTRTEDNLQFEPYSRRRFIRRVLGLGDAEEY
jgi:hypothetical protein